jgi:hypothetical protein
VTLEEPVLSKHVDPKEGTTDLPHLPYVRKRHGLHLSVLTSDRVAPSYISHLAAWMGGTSQDSNLPVPFALPILSPTPVDYTLPFVSFSFLGIQDKSLAGGVSTR